MEQTNSDASLQSGEVLFDRYKVDKFLGKGSFGEVYLVNDSTKSLEMAMKIIFNRNLETDSLSEIDLLKLIDCPNIVKYYDHILKDRKQFYFFIEYCSGGDLKQAIDKAALGKTQLENILDLSLQILNGIQYLHNRNIIHRDIKPENIFIAGDGTLKIGDLGIARDLHSFTRVGNTFAGTDFYMSPEIINQEQYNEKIDVWSYGCVVYEMVTLKKAFDGKNQPSVFEAILSKEPSIPKDLTPEISMIIRNCLKKNQNDRVSSVQLYGLITKSYTASDRVSSARSIGGWEPNGICIRTLIGHSENYGVEDLLVDSNNMLISACNDDTARFWDIDTAQCLNVLKPEHGPSSLTFSKEGNLITGEHDGTFTIWDKKTAKVLKHHRGHIWNIYDIEVNRQNQLITASGDHDAFIKVWNLDTLECVKTLNGHDDFVKCLTMKDDLLISGSKDTTIQLYNVESGQLLRTLKDHKEMIWCMAVDRNGNLISGCGYGYMKLWDLETGICIRDLGREPSGLIRTIIGHRGELIYCSWNRSIKFMDLRSSKVIKSILEASESSISSLVMDNKNRLISGSNGEIQVWDI